MRCMLVLALFLTIIVSGCGTTSTGALAPTQISTPSAQTPQEGAAGNGAEPTSSDQEGSVALPNDQTTPSSDGINSPGAGGDRTPGAPQPTQAGDTAGQTSAGAPGTSGGPLQTPGAGGPNDQPEKWRVYANQQFGFSIAYPDTYVVLDNDSPREPPVEGRVYQVRFQDSKLAASDTADLQLPQFRIELFEKPQGTTLEQWLDNHGIAGARSPVTIGDRNGYKVSYETMQAPNEFYYVAGDRYVYRLTPLGPHSEAMAATFSIRQ